MSGSTVSITANQMSTARRRVTEKNLPTGGLDSTVPAAAGGVDADKYTVVDKAAAIHRDGRTHAHAPPRKSNPARKSSKPRWLTIVSILTKNLAVLVVILGLIQMSRWAVLKSGSDTDEFSVISGDFDGKLAEVEKFVKTTIRAMQVQVNAIDKKIDDGVSSVRKEFDERMEKNGEEVGLKLKALDVRSDVFEKFINDFGTKNFLSKEQFGEFFEDFKKSRNNGVSDVSLDEIMGYARKVVEKEIEKHAADGLGMVDYALASGGGRVVEHSKLYGSGKLGGLLVRGRKIADSEKMLTPSFGEPGHCFPLKGGSGFVVVRLRTAIVPEAVTLEHVAKSVAYDRSSAPKHCRVSGWLQGQDSSDVKTDPENTFLLTEFTYDLEKSNAQTFKVLDSVSSSVVDTVRLDIASNHGSASHTCIYRLRVHGHEPDSAPVLEMQS